MVKYNFLSQTGPNNDFSYYLSIRTQKGLVHVAISYKYILHRVATKEIIQFRFVTPNF